MTIQNSDTGNPVADESLVPPVEPQEAETEAEGDDAPGEETEEAEAKPEGEEPEGEGDKDGEGEGDEQTQSRAQRRRARQKAVLVSLEQERDRLAARANAAERALSEFKEDLGEAPIRDSFDDEADYVAAKAAYEADKRAIIRQKSAVQAGATSAQQDAVSAKQNLFRERATALAERYPDIEAKVLNDASLPISKAMAEVLMETDRGPEVAYYLAGHREEAQRIASMQPLAAAAELGRIEAKLSAPKPRTETKAPKPVPTLSGGTTKVSKDPSRMSHEEYRAWRDSGGA